MTVNRCVAAATDRGAPCRSMGHGPVEDGACRDCGRPACAACSVILQPGQYRPAYAPLRADAGPLLCLPCDAAAWARLDAANADLPGVPGNDVTNVWD